MKTTLLLPLILVATTVDAFAPLPLTEARLHKTTRTLFSSTATPDDVSGSVTNCHVHLMTEDDLPPGYPNIWLNWLGTHKITRWIARDVLPWFDLLRDDDILERYGRLLTYGTSDQCQESNFEKLIEFYGDDVKFVVLPMDMRSWDPNHEPHHKLIEQHLELAKIAKNHPNKVFPFIHIDPRMNAKDEHGLNLEPVSFIRHLHQDGLEGIKFKGIKLYPPFGVQSR